jgi:RNA-directed DNA polymerase
LEKPGGTIGWPQSHAPPGFARIIQGSNMADEHPWYKSRHYLHFDPPVGRKRAERIATNPALVSTHAFYPMIAYHVETVKIYRDSTSGKIAEKSKRRPIAYAAHLDSQIYSYYAWKLSVRYEQVLIDKGIDKNVLAFRPLGKSNIQFAANAFHKVREMGNCGVVALDVTKFFDNLDHEILKKTWASLLGESRLPADHFAVFKSLTSFSHVDKEHLYQALNISTNNPKKDGRVRACDADIFRSVIRKGGMIDTNPNKYGIPQGSPISALLSNIYMINFDCAARKLADDVGGSYLRYCDDMLFIVPPAEKDKIEGNVKKLIKELQLDINEKKTEIREFRVRKGIQQSDKPLQYLGFTFDGQRVLIRSAALARYSEKMKRGVRFAKATRRKRNKLRVLRGEPPKALFRREIYQRYSHLGKRNFIRYGMNAADIMKSDAIKKQLKPLWNRLIQEIEL